jgi:hypothetical protein
MNDSKKMVKKKNYGALLSKLKIELTQNATSKPKKPKVEKTYQPTKVT